MDTNIIGRQITLLRKKFGLTQEDLALKLGYSKQTISNWETGLKTPRMGAIQKISDLFNVSKSFIIEGDQLSNTLTHITNISAKLDEKRQKKVLAYAEEQLHEQSTSVRKVVPLVGKSAANPSVLEYGDTDIEQQSFAHVPDNADCAIYIQGDSMEPLIKNGSIVFYKKQCDVENGEIAIVEIDGDGVTCKKLIKDYENELIILRSINKKYDDRVLRGEEIRIIGKVVTPDKD